MNDLGVAQAGSEIRQGRRSVTDLVESCLARIASVDPALRAWAVVDADGARRCARELQTEAEEGQLRGPLHGIPIGIKDNFWTAGLPTEAGSRVLAGFAAPEDAGAVARLKTAGAIVLGKTHMSEFGFSEPSPTRNPWDPGRTPGGSSSGSAVAVATGMCPAAIGSQTGGSVSRPAAYCGVVGLKPAHGRITTFGLIPISPLIDHVGIMARSVEDAVLLLTCVAGYDPRDPYTSAGPPPDYLDTLGHWIGPPRVGVLRRDFFPYADKETQMHTDAVAARLASAGASVEDLDLGPDFAAIRHHFMAVMKADAAAYHRAFKAKRDLYHPSSRQFLDEGLAVKPLQYREALEFRRRVQNEIVSGWLNQFDALLTPAAPGEAPAGPTSTGDSVMNSPWSFLGLPTVQLPSGLSRNGLPLGIQLVGSAAAEATLWATAKWCERALDVRLVPPGRTQAGKQLKRGGAT